MGQDIVNQIRDYMLEKPTDELLTIWEKNDRDQYSNDAFRAIESILRERGQVILDQNPYTSPVHNSRMRRLTFGLVWLCLVLFNLTAGPALLESMPSPFIIFIIFVIIEIIVLVEIVIKRLHDMDKGGLLTLCMFLPGFNVIFFIFLLFAPGSPGSNNYGANPRTSWTSEKKKRYKMFGLLVLASIGAFVLLVLVSLVFGKAGRVAPLLGINIIFWSTIIPWVISMLFKVFKKRAMPNYYTVMWVCYGLIVIGYFLAMLHD